MCPKVTFLVPAFNALPDIRYTVDSILSQSLRDFHAIIINDGSTDGTGEWLDSINDSRFQIVHQENTGYVTALNRGAALVKTPYIARLDADDIALPTRLEKQVRFLDENPEVAVVGARIAYIFLKNHRFSLGFGQWKTSPEFSPPMKEPPFWDPLQDGQTIAHPSATIRSSVFDSVGGYRVIPPAEDIDLWFRIRDSGHRLACLPEVLVLYRIGTGSVSSQAYARQLLMTKYAHHCHLVRKQGGIEPSFEDFSVSHPPSQEELASGRVKLQLRNAMGNLLAGKFLLGGIKLSSLAVSNPGVVWTKFRTRC